MTSWILNGLYLAVYALMLPRILYRRMVQGRPLGNFGQRFLGRCPAPRESSHEVIWFHAVSVGEVNLLATLIEQTQARRPQATIAISTTTATGFEMAKQRYSDHLLFYFPIDFSWAVRNVLRRLRPSLLVLAELELWPNLIRIAHQRAVPMAVVNGRLSERSFVGYRRASRLVRPMFERLNWIGVQDEIYATRFLELGCDPDAVHVTGSLKFDGAVGKPCPKLAAELAKLISLTPKDVLFVAGSTQEPEEELAAQCWLDLRNQFPQLRLVVVPRHPHRADEIVERLEALGIEVGRRTQTTQRPVGRDCVMVVDTIGELTAWWNLAKIAYVGGSMGARGGQNMIEPAAAGCAISFGPNTRNFQQVVQLLLQDDAATVVCDQISLRDFLSRCLEDPGWREEQTERARRMVNRHLGATEKTTEGLRQILDRSLRHSRAA